MIEYNIRKLVKEIINFLEIKKTRKLTDSEHNELSFLRACLKEILRNFELNKFLKILYRKKLEKEELEQIEKIKEKEIQDINIFLSIYNVINSKIFFDVWKEYKQEIDPLNKQKIKQKEQQKDKETTTTTTQKLDLKPPKKLKI